MKSSAERIKFVPGQPLRAKKRLSETMEPSHVDGYVKSAYPPRIYSQSRRSKIRRQKEAAVRRQHVGIGRGTCLESIPGNSWRGPNYFRVTRKLFSGRPDAAGDGPPKQSVSSQRVLTIAWIRISPSNQTYCRSSQCTSQGFEKKGIFLGQTISLWARIETIWRKRLSSFIVVDVSRANARVYVFCVLQK